MIIIFIQTFLMVASMSVPPRGADGDLFQG